jgi:poly-D-alanine transfer protein DltD
MAIIPKEKLDLWIQKRKNVALIGSHGVGKTHIVLEAFREHGLNCLYFSAPTMDPWIDLVGIPRETHAEINGERVDYIELIPPKPLALDEIDVIFLSILD